MRKLLIAAAAAAFAAPAFAAPDPVSDEELDREIVRAIPPPEEVERMAPVMDRVVGAVLDVDIGPIVDAVDPHGRHRRYDRRERTIGDLASRDDPQFEERVRSSIYGVTANMGRVMETMAVLAPTLRRSLHQIERDIQAAIENRPPRRAPDYDPRNDRRADDRPD